MLWLLALLISALAFIFSMLGLGGAMVYNPLMVWFGYDFKTVVVPTGLLLNGLTAASAAWTYHRERMIDFPAALPLILASTLGAPVGAYLSQFVPTQTLLALFSLAVAAAGLRMLLPARRPEPEAVRGTRAQRMALGIGLGLGVGVIAGLLGIGGGFLIVPLLMMMGYPMKTAAATTAFTVVFSSISGFAGHLALGHIDWGLMAMSSAAVLVGSQLGSRTMVSRMQPAHLRRLFGVVLLAIAARLIYGLS